MKSLHIRGLDEAVVEGLKRRARRHRRSLQKEVELVLTDAARMAPPEAASVPSMKALLRTVATGKRADRWSREEIYDDAGR
jgi:plasmid stability protein